MAASMRVRWPMSVMSCRKWKVTLSTTTSFTCSAAPALRQVVWCVMRVLCHVAVWCAPGWGLLRARGAQCVGVCSGYVSGQELQI